MPARVNTTGDIGNALDASDSYDKDNIFLTDEGWVYRHYKNDALTKFWDEIIVAGEVDPAATIGGVANAPVDAIADASPTFETGDGKKDVEYSPNFNSTSSGGGGGGGGAAGSAVALTLTGATAGNVAYETSNGDNGAVSLTVGDTLTITNNSGGHPVIITESDGGAATSEGSTTGSPAGDGGALVWDTTGAAAGTYYYQCQSHAGMIGTITLNS
jgi:plastocyanin